MSNKMIDMVFSMDLPPTDKFVAVAIANHADKDGECYPSIELLASETGYNERTVYRSISNLRRIKLLETFKKRGKKSKNFFRFLMGDNLPSCPDRESGYLQHNSAKADLTESQGKNTFYPDTQSQVTCHTVRCDLTHSQVPIKNPQLTPIEPPAQTQPKKKKPASKKTKKEKIVFEIPDWIPKEDWEGYLEMREQKKKPLTEYAFKLIIKNLDNFRKQGTTPQMALQQSIVNGWTGVFEVKNFNSHGKQPKKQEGKGNAKTL